MNQKDLFNNNKDVATRYLTQEPARIEIYGKREVVYARMSNLSTTGAFFEIVSSSYTPKPGELVCITVNLKKLNKYHILNGQVVWLKGTGLGVSFIKQQDLLKKVVKAA